MQAVREARRDGDDIVPAQIGNGMIGFVALSEYGGVCGGCVEAAGPLRAQPDGVVQEPELGRAIFEPVVQAAQKFLRCAVAQPVQHLLAAGVVHGAAVVRVHERVVPQFPALVKVGYAGRGAFQQSLREGICAAIAVDATDKLLQLLEKWRAGEEAIDEVFQSFFILFVVGRPGGLKLGLAHGLLHVLLRAFRIDGPCTDECLIKEVFRVRIRVFAGAQAAVHAGPALELGGPARGCFRENGNPRTHVIGTLGVMRGKGGHGAGKGGLHACVVIMELLDADAARCRISANLIEGGKAVVIVESRILHALGHDG